ncbi:hypothetical protein [Methanimicrococcus stummii]|nr:hypothetical protein [Methanimicrococcus sp. Es2]
MISTLNVAAAIYPNKPYYIQAIATDSDRITVSWGTSAYATEYHVYRSAAGGPFMQIGATGGTVFYDGWLAPSTVYSYYVVPYNRPDNIYGPPSDSAGAMTPMKLNPPTPYANTINSSAIHVTWNSVMDATHYKLYRSTSAGGGFIEIANLTGATYTDTGLGADTTYYYVVRAHNAYYNIDSEQSTIASAKTLPYIPEAPVVFATALNTTAIDVEWNSIPNVDGYRIYRSLNEFSGYDLIEQTMSFMTRYEDTRGLIPDTTYYYKVMGFTYLQDGILSQPAGATTLKIGVPVLTAEAVDTQSIQLTWNAVPDAFDYDVYRSDDENGVYVLIDMTDLTQYLDSGLSPSTTYYYKVSVYDGSQRGEQSAPAWATTKTPQTPGPSTPEPKIELKPEPDINSNVKTVTSGSPIQAFEAPVEEILGTEVKNGAAGFVFPLFLLLAVLTTGVLYVRAKRRNESKK